MKLKNKIYIFIGIIMLIGAINAQGQGTQRVGGGNNGIDSTFIQGDSVFIASGGQEYFSGMGNYLLSRIAFVDKNKGNNATAIVGDISKPFKDPYAAAKYVRDSGDVDLIYVFPATWRVGGALADVASSETMWCNCNIHFLPGSKIEIDGTTNVLFWNKSTTTTTGADTLRVTGDLSVTTRVGGQTSYIFGIDNPSTTGYGPSISIELSDYNVYRFCFVNDTCQDINIKIKKYGKTYGSIAYFGSTQTSFNYESPIHYKVTGTNNDPLIWHYNNHNSNYQLFKIGKLLWTGSSNQLLNIDGVNTSSITNTNINIDIDEMYGNGVLFRHRGGPAVNKSIVNINVGVLKPTGSLGPTIFDGGIAHTSSGNVFNITIDHFEQLDSVANYFINQGLISGTNKLNLKINGLIKTTEATLIRQNQSTTGFDLYMSGDVSINSPTTLLSSTGAGLSSGNSLYLKNMDVTTGNASVLNYTGGTNSNIILRNSNLKVNGSQPVIFSQIDNKLVLQDVTLINDTTVSAIQSGSPINIIVKSAYTNSLLTDSDVTELVQPIIRNSNVK